MANINKNKALRSSRMTKFQKEFLVSFLEQNTFLLETKLNPAMLDLYKNTWDKLANELNNIQGARKNVKQWKEALNDFKVTTRKKARLAHNEAVSTGGGPKTTKDLTPLEERLLALLSQIVITGAPTVPEAGVNTSIQNAATPYDVSNNLLILDDLTEYILRDGPSTSTADLLLTSTVCEANKKVTSSKPTSSTSPTRRKINGRRRAKKLAEAEFSTVAKKHEECLQAFANSNNNVAAATYRLAHTVNKRARMTSSVFQLKF